MSNVTIDLAQLDTSLSVMLLICMSMIRLTAVEIRHPLTIITWKTSRFALHISWYSMSHLPIQHKNEATPGWAVSRRPVVLSYMREPNWGQLTAVKMGHVQTTIILVPRARRLSHVVGKRGALETAVTGCQKISDNWSRMCRSYKYHGSSS